MSEIVSIGSDDTPTGTYEIGVIILMISGEELLTSILLTRDDSLRYSIRIRDREECLYDLIEPLRSHLGSHHHLSESLIAMNIAIYLTQDFHSSLDLMLDITLMEYLDSGRRLIERVSELILTCDTEHADSSL